ncbi:hypothetical protein R1flu_000268 [Riccia fluitans]|uniref:Uncharacterized protein n=1 Tax=Riccia fluitans TaxID=41844 RepID=A0ABD1XZZ2_9MARC
MNSAINSASLLKKVYRLEDTLSSSQKKSSTICEQFGLKPASNFLKLQAAAVMSQPRSKQHELDAKAAAGEAIVLEERVSNLRSAWQKGEAKADSTARSS